MPSRIFWRSPYTTLRWVFMTSSYFSTFLRCSKFCSSTFFCAVWMARVTILASMGSSSGQLKRSMMRPIRSEANRRINSSPSDR